MALFTELSRRRVFRVAAIYLAVAWGATEMLTFVFDRIPIFPYWLGTVVTILFVLGFPVSMFLAWMFDIGRDGISRTRPATVKGGLTIAGALTLLAAATYGFAIIILSDSQIDRRLAGSQLDGPPTNSIAILPFVNLSGDPKDDIFGDGLAEELTHQLAAAESLFVVGRTSAFYFKNKNAEYSEIRERLRVAHVLEGSVRRLEDDIRVTSQLIDTDTGYEVWSSSFDGEIRNLLDIHLEIAKAVAETLGTVIRNADETAYKPSEKTDFYERYLEGLSALRAEEDGAATMALDIFSALLGDNPDFHGAQFGIAMAYYHMAAAGFFVMG